MKTNLLTILSRGFILFSALSLLSVSLMAFVNPQSVMDLVQVNLPNTDAFSSIRGVYGGVGLTIFISLLYLMRKDIHMGLIFLSMLWGFYVLSRLMTIFSEGSLGAFGTQWLCIESILFGVSVILLFLHKRTLAINY
ncbi:DUF4345 domain-containing protein [Cytophagaceae bacterium YF14B1]|uniref:DUF4345 domain-containing protein n=1 Tax=Xanthocytophaga flava TaxID=3048013 RepID=A0AAE3QPY4_9BACT|nr:DUF4345 domain-containing protein [Xanthocytophaga flavus]MDJ1483327.1 DUF4345 domain-containing protein [Xanthocytophaga flavus]